MLKRYSFIGDGLAHVAFGAMAIASVLQMTSFTYLMLPVTVLAAVLLLRTGNHAKIKGDAAVAMISVASLAFGYMLMNILPTSPNVSGDVCVTLFGSTSILTLKKEDMILCILLSVLVLLFFIFFYHKIFDVTFDEDFAKASGTKVNTYNTLIAIIIAVIIVVSMNLVGSLLISALIIFPALSAMRLFKSFKGVTICSAVISVLGAVFGILASILMGTPVGSTIVSVDVVLFFLCRIIGRIGGKG